MPGVRGLELADVVSEMTCPRLFWQSGGGAEDLGPKNGSESFPDISTRSKMTFGSSSPLSPGIEVSLSSRADRRKSWVTAQAPKEPQQPIVSGPALAVGMG